MRVRRYTSAILTASFSTDDNEVLPDKSLSYRTDGQRNVNLIDRGRIPHARQKVPARITIVLLLGTYREKDCFINKRYPLPDRLTRMVHIKGPV